MRARLVTTSTGLAPSVAHMRAYESSKEVGNYGLADFFIDRMNDLRNRICGDPDVPTLIHVTHAKAGSTWIAHLLARLFGSRCAPRGTNALNGCKVADYVFQSGRVYSAMFLTRDEVTAHAELEGVSRFVVIRDLRDTLISLYFSLKVSHASGHRLVDSTREMLQDLSEEEGLLHLIENNLSRIAALQTSWLGHDDLVLSYESPAEGEGPGAIVLRRLSDGVTLAMYDVRGVSALALAPDGGSFVYSTGAGRTYTAVARVPR